jgi:hypothetical protein
MLRDDVFKNINLPGINLVFTRYLFVKEEVRIALLVCLINKDCDAFFWAFELFYSGFKCELFDLLWKIYYDLFHSSNPLYEIELFRKRNIYYKQCSDEQRAFIICEIVNNFINRKFNLDVFMLRNICDTIVVDVEYTSSTKIDDLQSFRNNMTYWIEHNDFRSIAQWILCENKTLNIADIYSVCLDLFNFSEKQKDTNMKLFKAASMLNLDKNSLLLSKIMALITKKKNNKNKEISFIITSDDEELEKYKTISIKHNKILKTAYDLCDGIDFYNNLCLFKLTRDKIDVMDKYLHNWEFHASLSPLWLNRIKQHGGYQDFVKQKIIFKEEPDDELMQQFYETYGLEPDEQSLETHNKTIPKKSGYTWIIFYKNHNANGLFKALDEELEELEKMLPY